MMSSPVSTIILYSYNSVLTASPRYHVEDVWCISIEHSEVFEVVSSLDHQEDVDTNDKVEGAQEWLVVLPVTEVEVVGQFLRDCLVPSLGCRGLRRNQPATWSYSSENLKNVKFYENTTYSRS